MIRFYNLIFLILFFTSFFNIQAQVGFNNPNPDSSALIDMKANDKGLLIPRMSTTERTLMVTGGKRVAHALLVFDTDQNMFFVFDTIANPDKWVVLNPWNSTSKTGNITTPVTGNVGIGTSTPTAKLEVNGNIKSSGNVTTTGNISSSGSISSTSVIATGNISSGSITTGNINSSGNISASGFSGIGTIPIGGIIMWSGIIVPAGWALCDGQNVNGYTTPDLRGRFIVGYDPSRVDYDNPGSFSIGGTNIGDTGGEEMHTLTISEMPSHNHSYADRYSASQNSAVGTSGTRSTAGTYLVDNTSLEGGGQPHENRPPYYALAFIMRVQ